MKLANNSLIKNGFHPALDKAMLNLNLRMIERKSKSMDREVAHILTRDGRLISRKYQDADRMINTSGIGKFLKGNILTHNHPKFIGISGSPISPADAVTGFKSGLHEIRAVTGDNLYILTRPEKQLSTEEIKYGLNNIKIINDFIKSKINEGLCKLNDRGLICFDNGQIRYIGTDMNKEYIRFKNLCNKIFNLQNKTWNNIAKATGANYTIRKAP